MPDKLKIKFYILDIIFIALFFCQILLLYLQMDRSFPNNYINNIYKLYL